MSKPILITGGAGFIGSAVIRHLIKNTNTHVVNVDSLTYAGNLESLKDVSGDPRYTFEKVDIKSKVSGQVLEVLVDEGAVVTKGQLLLRLDPVDYARDVARSEAELAHFPNSGCVFSLPVEVPGLAVNFFDDGA